MPTFWPTGTLWRIVCDIDVSEIVSGSAVSRTWTGNGDGDLRHMLNLFIITGIPGRVLTEPSFFWDPGMSRNASA